MIKVFTSSLHNNKVESNLEARRVVLTELGAVAYDYWLNAGKPEFTILAMQMFNDDMIEVEQDIATALALHSAMESVEIHVESVEKFINEYELYLLLR